MIDVDKLLQLDYINSILMQIDDKISLKKELLVDEYKFDILRTMKPEDINMLFNNYGVKNNNLLKYIQSDFLDESWEYADLYSEDITYSSDEKDKLFNLVLEEISLLNEKIALENNKVQEEISILENDVEMLKIFIKAIDEDDLIVDEEVEKMKEFIINCSLIRDEDRFKLSVNVIKYLIANKKKILLKKEFVDTLEFEKELTEVRSNVTMINATETSDILPYSKKIDEYYEKYRELFNEQGYSNIFELMEVLSKSCEEIGKDIKSISKNTFCRKIADLLVQLNSDFGDEFINDALTNLEMLDELYDLNQKYDEYKNSMLEKIEDLTLKINNNISIVFDEKVALLHRLNLLHSELINNFINNERKEEIELDFEDIEYSFSSLLQIEEMLVKINDYELRVTKLLKNSDIFETIGNDKYQELIQLRNNFLNLKNDIVTGCNNEDIISNFKIYVEKLLDIEDKLNDSTEEKTKTVLKGFVLFDVSEEGQAYVVSDLDPSHKDKLIDVSIESGDLNKGYENINKLIKDLHLIGTTERLANKDSHAFNSDRLNEAVYWDPTNRTAGNETGMYRIRYERNGVERFVERKIVLHPGTKLCEQITNIIKEILPDVEFDYSEDINLYICFAVSMKKDDHETYRKSINRYKKQSLLYRLFMDKRYNLKKIESLSAEECKIFKDFINLTLQAYTELKEKNAVLSFDIIKQIGGMKTRG